MGGDHGPGPIVEGACRFIRTFGDAEVVLVGRQELVEAEISSQGQSGQDRLSIVNATQVVEMHEKVDALRVKKDSSILRLVKLVKEGGADAMVALGNTSASVAAAKIGLRNLEGVRRAGIAVPMPTSASPCVVIDMGANVVCKPEHLIAYGVMAEIYSHVILGTENPRVGLLNVGEEDGKGNELLRRTLDLFRSSSLNFVGNVEGRDIYNGACDVVVCDGFVGNVVLKASEQLAQTLLGFMREEIGASLIAKIGALLCKGAFREVKRRTDPAMYGGAPLLGANGICIIGHGHSGPEAVFNALRVARESVEQKLNEKIKERLRRRRELGLSKPAETESGQDVAATGRS